MGFWEHIRPRFVYKGQLNFSSTFALGGALFLTHIVLAVTGALLMFYYEPTPQGAYVSVKLVQEAVPFGWFFRSLHRISADIVIVLTVAHTTRVFYTGAYQGRRALNWIIGVAIMFFTFILAYTGYLLPWDQTGYWAVVVVSNLLKKVPWIGGRLFKVFLAGEGVSSDTLLRFYVLHCVVIPWVLFVLLGIHLYYVRKAGGVAVGNRIGPKVKSYPELYRRELVASSILLSILVLLAVFFNAPLGPICDPSRTPNPAKAPWFFCGIQYLLRYLPPFIAGVFIPFSTVILLLFTPLLSKGGEGVWFSSERRVSIVIYTMVLTFAVLATILGVLT